MKRKAIFALAVAVAMLVAVIPVSAGSSYDYGTYGGSYYEVSATCNSESYSASTHCESTTYKVRADACTGIWARARTPCTSPPFIPTNPIPVLLLFLELHITS